MLGARLMVLLEVWRYCLRLLTPWVTVSVVFHVFVCFCSWVALEMKIIFDSGIRTGADVFKAIALGAHVVMVGRLYVWGMAHEGEAGCRHVIKSLLAVSDPVWSTASGQG